MDAFSLLRYWKTNGGDVTTNVSTSTSSTTAIVTAVSTQTSETGDEENDENDHGPFFDLEFSLPEGETENGVVYGEEDEEECDGSDESEMKFTLISGSSNDSTADANVSVSPSDELFFKGSFVPVEQTTTEIISNSKPLQSRVSLMKSATKFKVMMFNFNKSKPNSSEDKESSENKESKEKNGESEDSGKSMTLKFKVEEVPIVSLLKRHNSSKAPKKRQNDDESVEEKKFSKEAMQKYLRKVKPLYVRVSKRYGEKLRFSGQLSLPGVTKQNIAPSPATETVKQKQSPAANSVSEPLLLPSNAKGLKQGNLPAGLRVVCKHLGKSRSASTAVAAAASPSTLSTKRRDDSLLQQQDGIQSAILHCKRSFKASRDSDCSSGLSSESVPAYGYSSSSDAVETVEMKSTKGEGDDFSQKAGN